MTLKGFFFFSCRIIWPWLTLGTFLCNTMLFSWQALGTMTSLLLFYLRMLLFM